LVCPERYRSGWLAHAALRENSALMQITRRHTQRLRQMFRSAGWPFQDVLEAELLAAGLLARERADVGCERLRVTDAGVAAISASANGHRAALSAHEALVQRVAAELSRAGRIVWRGLGLRVPLPPVADQNAAPAQAQPAQAAIECVAHEPGGPSAAPRARWLVACPDVFSLRHTSVEAYLEPVVHEIKVSRADLLGDLKRPDKRAAYLQMGGACWYVLGRDARGRPIAQPDEVPPECGVMQCGEGDRLAVLRPAPRRPVERLPFHVWMALARATPQLPPDDAQGALVGAD
jgi:hypothetical protein